MHYPIYFLFCLFISLLPHRTVSQKYNQLDANGKRHGSWRKYFKNSTKIRYEGQFDHGKEIGEFKFYKPSSEGRPTAIKTFYSDQDSVSVRYFSRKGKVISRGKMITKQREGKWLYFHLNSTKILKEEYYKKGKLHGLQKTYFINGQLTERSEYLDGKREGIREIFSEEGVKIKSFHYKNNLLNGNTQYFDTSGELLIEGHYKNDRKDGIWKYYEKGVLKNKKRYPLSKS